MLLLVLVYSEFTLKVDRPWGSFVCKLCHLHGEDDSFQSNGFSVKSHAKFSICDLILHFILDIYSGKKC